MQIYAVVAHVRNLHISKDLQRASGRTSGLLDPLSCGLVNLHPALAFLAECKASQTQQGKLHGVSLFDRPLNRPSTDLADFPGRAWIPVTGSVEGRYYLSRTVRDGQSGGRHQAKRHIHRHAQARGVRRVIEKHQETERPLREHQVRAELDALLMRVAQYATQRRIHAIVRRRSREGDEPKHEQNRGQQRYGPPCPTLSSTS